MVEVSAGLYLGNEDDAGEVVYGRKHKEISHILTITKDAPAWHLKKTEAEVVLPEQSVGEVHQVQEKPRGGLKTLHIQVNDSPKEDLLGHFDKCYLFIQEGLEHGAILVHW